MIPTKAPTLVGAFFIQRRVRYPAPMPRLTKIYTKTGDAGDTMLGDGSRVRKSSARVAAYGDVDEANSAIGLAISAAHEVDSLKPLRSDLLSIQQDLFDVGADLCTPKSPNEKTGEKLRITDGQITRIERMIDSHNAGLGALESFILPGGSEVASRLHLARTIVRRAERRVEALVQAEPDATNPRTLVYLNRVSDLLFVMARVANREAGGDVLWIPGANRSDE